MPPGPLAYIEINRPGERVRKLLDQTNYTKPLAQVLRLLDVLGCEVSLSVVPSARPQINAMVERIVPPMRELDETAAWLQECGVRMLAPA